VFALVAVLVIAVAVIGVGGLVGAWRLGETQRGGRVLALAALAVSGVVAGFVGSVTQSSVVHLGGSSGSASGSGIAEALAGQASVRAAGSGSGGIGIPVGPVLALLMLALALFCGVALLRSPTGALIPGGGWLVAVATFMYGSDKGDVVLENTGSAQFFLYGGFLLAAAFALGAQQWQLREQLRAR
jgi:hypothetical protein